jgi:uncharacterized protein YjbI with pentapeptide repeats
MAKELKPDALELHELWVKSGGFLGERLDLSRANLRVTNLEEADIFGANLYRAFLNGTNLRRAYLKGANLYEANFFGADLEGADFSGAKNLDKAIIPMGWKLVKEDSNG